MQGEDTGSRLKREFKRGAKIGGYVDVSPTTVPTDNRRHGWQLYMSILPTRTNLDKAADALDGIDFPFNTKLRIISPRVLKDGSLELAGYWDATQSFKIAGVVASDRDQRGKEICVPMYFDSDTENYQFTQAEYKRIMLAMWKAMQDAGVTFSYVQTPPGTIAINAAYPDLPRTPFCYSANKPHVSKTIAEYKKLEFEIENGQQLENKEAQKYARHGVLLHSSGNPYGYNDDPLAEFYITDTDLNRAGIKQLGILSVLQKQKNYHQSHVQMALQALILDFKSLIAQMKVPDKKLLQRRPSLVPTAQLKQSEEKLLSRWLSERDAEQQFPVCADRKGTNVFLLYKPLLAWAKDNATDAQKNKIVEHFLAASKYEEQSLLADFQDKRVAKFLVKHAIVPAPDSILNPVALNENKDSAHLMSLYRRLIHVLNEEESLNNVKAKIALLPTHSLCFATILGLLIGTGGLTVLYFSLLKPAILTLGFLTFFSAPVALPVFLGVAVLACFVTTLVGFVIACYENNYLLPALSKKALEMQAKKTTFAKRLVMTELGLLCGILLGDQFFASIEPGTCAALGAFTVNLAITMCGYALGRVLTTPAPGCAFFGNKKRDAIELNPIDAKKNLTRALLNSFSPRSERISINC